MRFLTDLLPNAKSYATREAALAKLRKSAHLIPDEATVLATQRDDGRWLAVVIYRGTLSYAIPAITGAGIVLTD